MRPCRFPGCSALLTDTSYCGKHTKIKAKSERRRDNRASASERGYGALWRKRRLAYLKKNPICESRLCTSISEEVDHIIPKAQGGTDDEYNLQALCKSCHSKKTTRERRELATSHVIVFGAPGSGKSSYVRSRYKYGDLVLDLDSIYSAISWQPLHTKPRSILPFALAAYDALLEAVERDDVGEVRRVFVIGGFAKKSTRERMAQKLNATPVLIDTPMAECKKRIKSCPHRGPRSDQYFPIIARWFANFEPSDKDIKYNQPLTPPGAGQ